MDKLLETITNWAPNRWLMFGGFVGVFFFGSSGFAGVVPTADLAIAGMAISAAMILLGAWYARESARFAAQEKRRSQHRDRPTAPVSELSIDYAEQLRGSVTMDQLIASNPPLQLDAQKTHDQLLETVCRLRIREAARDGSVVYYEAGHYIPRDVTVYGKT